MLTQNVQSFFTSFNSTFQIQWVGLLFIGEGALENKQEGYDGKREKRGYLRV